MSEPPKPQGNSDEENKQLLPKNAAAADKDEEDEEFTCKSCWNGYCGCVVWTCKCIYNSILFVKNKIVQCCSAVWYPLKERCCSCCDRCDKKYNPYKNSDFDPYDTL